jgi:voltage-gated potassium channel
MIWFAVLVQVKRRATIPRSPPVQIDSLMVTWRLSGPPSASRLTIPDVMGASVFPARVPVDGPGGRLAAYEARTEKALDLLALLTLWIVVVPPWDFGHDVGGIALTIRVAVSVVYGIDLAIRGVLARRPVRYALTHPVMLVSVAFPPVRVIFSFRLVRSVFRRGHLGRFLVAASVLVLNGAVIVYLFERHAPESSIRTLGESLWWSLVTVTTVGYGDYTPVTAPGRVTACFVMGIGLLTLAVVTAQVASSFVAQGRSCRARCAAHRPNLGQLADSRRDNAPILLRRVRGEDTKLHPHPGTVIRPGKPAMMTPLVAEARRQANNALTPGEQALPEPGWDFPRTARVLTSGDQQRRCSRPR